MKLLKGAAFTHPVVSPLIDDVKENGFRIQNFTVKADGSNYLLSIEFELSNSGLREYIQNGLACYALLMEARSFFYRHLHRPLKQIDELIIDGHRLSGTVDCVPLVIATRDIPEYTLPGLNDDYIGTKISVSAGDVLAISTGCTFVAEKEHDMLQKLSSIIQVIGDSKVGSGCMEIDVNGEKLTVFVCAEDHAKYSALKDLPEAAPILMQLFAMPALQEAIVEINKEDSRAAERRWGLALKKRLDAKKITIDSSPAHIACRVLDGPLSASLARVDRLVASGGDE